MLKETLFVVLVGSLSAQAMDFDGLVNACEMERPEALIIQSPMDSQEDITREIQSFNDKAKQTPPKQRYIDRRQYGYTIGDSFVYSGQEAMFLEERGLSSGSKNPRRLQASTVRTMFNQSAIRTTVREPTTDF